MKGVNHPDHYNQQGRKECIVEMREQFGDTSTAIFCLMSAYKYLYRMGNKHGETANKDLQKARWYVDYYEQFLLDNLSENNIINYITELHESVVQQIAYANDDKEE